MLKTAKFIPMVLLFFLMLLSQNIVRSMKDSIIITYISAEILSFIKLYGEIPLSILFVLIYTILCNKYGSERVFRYVICFFLAFFSFFSFYVLPNLNVLNPSKIYITDLCNSYQYVKWFILMWGHWCLIIFYILGELWSVVLCTILFWQLANKITSSEEAKNHYPLYTFFGQFNLIISSQLILFLLNKNDFFFQFKPNDTEEIFQLLTFIVCICGLISIFIQIYIDKKYIVKNKPINQKQIKKKLTLKQSLNIIMSSKYLLYIAFILVSYGACVILIEGIWFAKAKQKYPLLSDFMAYHAKVMMWTGISCMCFSIIAKILLKYSSWFFCAIITPILFLTCGTAFFIFSLFQSTIENLLNYQVLSLVVFLGGLQNIIIKGAKYTLFDVSKEMTYLLLSEPLKTEGKAAVDLISFKLGKSVAALIQFLIFTMYPNYSYNNIVLYLLVFFIFFCILWIYAIRNLSKEYEVLSNQSTIEQPCRTQEYTKIEKVILRTS